MSLISRIVARLMKLPPAVTHNVRVEKNIIIPMSDGTPLVADRYFPQLKQKSPTILIRSPYGKGMPMGLLLGRMAAERGFNVLIQCVRGTFGSGGEMSLLVQEDKDGRDTMEWLKEQPWFNGVVGTMGMSYLGYAQWAVAANYGRYLKSMSVCVSTSSFHKQFYMGDSFGFQSHLGWAWGMKDAHKSVKKMKPSEKILRINSAAMHLPLGDVDQVVAGRSLKLWRDVIDNSEPPYDYWQKADHGKKVGEVTAKVNFTTGWFDIFLPWTLDDYQQLTQSGRRPYLTIGPWAHTSAPLMAASLRQGLNWHSAHLMSKPFSIRQRPVKIYVMGAKQWREYDQWPPAGNRLQSWYLQSGGGLAPGRPATSAPDHYRYDPADPTPNIGGALMSPRWGQKDNRRLEARQDVLTYTSNPLAGDLEVIGPVTAELYVRSNRLHTDFFVRLCDVTPGGKSLNVCDGLQRVRPDYVAADLDGILRLTIRLWPTAYCFKAGHRLRVQVSSGAHPRYARNTGSGEPIATAVNLLSADQEVFHDPERASAVVLSVEMGAHE